MSDFVEQEKQDTVQLDSEAKLQNYDRFLSGKCPVSEKNLKAVLNNNTVVIR